VSTSRQGAGQPRPDLTQQLIAVMVAERVVDLFEPVQVDRQQPGRAARASGA